MAYFKWFLCVAPNSWGRGKDMESAIAECRKHYHKHVGRNMKQYILYGFTTDDFDPFVDECGSIHYGFGQGMVEIADYTKREL